MRIVVSNASEAPIYEQIKRQIKGQIIDGSLTEGAPLPSIRRLAKELQVSVITTKRAYDDLEQEGFIDSVAGKGTFVAVHSTEFLREQKLHAIEQRIATIVDEARTYGVEARELHEMIDVLWRDGE